MAENPDIGFLKARIEALQQGSSALSSTGGGGGDSGGSEPRIAKLEADVAHLVNDLRDIRDSLRDAKVSLAEVRERMVAVEIKLDHLPGKGFIVMAVSTGLALLTAVLLFQDKLQHAFSLSAAGK